MRPRHELQRLIEEGQTSLKTLMHDLDKAQQALVEVPEDKWPIMWPDRQAHVNVLKLQISDLRMNLDGHERAIKERRPAIVRVYLDDLGLED